MVTAAEVGERAVEIPAGRRRLGGVLAVPSRAAGVVAFAHGSGSGRFSPRNRQVAGALQEAGLATLLLDLLEEEEAQDRAKVFDIPLLAERLQAAAGWLRDQESTSALSLGYFGSSTGAAAALLAAALGPKAVHAVVSRGGRPDLVLNYLPAVWAPTLLIVGGNDDLVLVLNQQALALLRSTKELAIVPHAGHLFEEHGALEQVSRLASQWFLRYLPREDAGGEARRSPRGADHVS